MISIRVSSSVPSPWKGGCLDLYRLIQRKITYSSQAQHKQNAPSRSFFRKTTCEYEEMGGYHCNPEITDDNEMKNLSRLCLCARGCVCVCVCVCTFIACLSSWASYWAGVFSRASTTSSRSPFRALFSADSRVFDDKIYSVNASMWSCACTLEQKCKTRLLYCWEHYFYLATGLLVSRFDLLSLLVAPFHQNFNDGVLVHACTKDMLLR